MNYFLGIRASGRRARGRLRGGRGGRRPGLNHPVAGVTPIVNGAWHHAAATYDGTTWKLYLDGILETTLSVGQPPQAASTQHGGARQRAHSTGRRAGFFDGVLDEARVWNYARTEAEIQSTANAQLADRRRPAWSRAGALNEGSGTAVDGLGRHDRSPARSPARATPGPRARRSTCRSTIRRPRRRWSRRPNAATGVPRSRRRSR